MVKTALIALAALFLLNFISLPLGVWSACPIFLSVTFHFLGGFFVAMLIASFYNNEFGKLPQYLRLLVVIGMTLAVGTFWEFFEYSASALISPWLDQTYHISFQFIGDLNDTIQDLVMDTLGAVASVAITASYLRRRFNAKKK